MYESHYYSGSTLDRWRYRTVRFLKSPLMQMYVHTIVANLVALSVFTTVWAWLQ